jgi:hypothetical protein
MKPQALKAGGYYWITTHRWRGERRMEFLRKAPDGRLVFALPHNGNKSPLRFENLFRRQELLSFRPVEQNDGEEVLLVI